MPVINFFTVHPRTAEWWVEREQCMRCRHMCRRPTVQRKNGSASGGGMLCTAVNPGPGGDATCITAREGECGHDAKLFEPLP